MAATQVKGVNVTKFDAGTSNANWIDQGLIKSSMKVWSDTYVTALEEVASTIQLAELPAGAVVHYVHLVWELASPGAATGILGDSNDDNRYVVVADIDLSAAGEYIGCAPTGIQYVIGTNSGDTDVIMTIAGATLNAGADIYCAVYYTN